MKSMRPPLAAIFFMIYFHRAGGNGPSVPLDPLLGGLLAWWCLPQCVVGHLPVGGVSAPVHTGIQLHLWTEFLTHACENITFPQLLLRTVTSPKQVSKEVC